MQYSGRRLRHDGRVLAKRSGFCISIFMASTNIDSAVHENIKRSSRIVRSIGRSEFFRQKRGKYSACSKTFNVCLLVDGSGGFSQ